MFIDKATSMLDDSGGPEIQPQREALHLYRWPEAGDTRLATFFDRIMNGKRWRLRGSHEVVAVVEYDLGLGFP